MFWHINKSPNQDTKQCKECKTYKSIEDFDKRVNRQLRTRCRECEHPPCVVCLKRIDTIWTPNPAVIDDKPVCSDLCRETYRKNQDMQRTKECSECKQRKTIEHFDNKGNWQLHSRCRECQHPPCSQCGRILIDIWRSTSTKPVCHRKACHRKMQ